MESSAGWFELRRPCSRGAPKLFATLSASVLLALVGACAPSVRHAVSYSGAAHEPRVSAAELVSVATAPEGYELTGELLAECEAWRHGSPVDQQWLVDLDCTERRLRGALREKAAAVGGQLLVRERCQSMPRAAGSSREAGGRLRCRAQVARLDAGERSAEPLSLPRLDRSQALAASPAQAASLDDPTGAQAWRIRVSYSGLQPASGVPVPLVPASAVHEWSELPPSHQAVGTVVTSCEVGCSVDAMRASVRVVAGRLGAGDVVGVRCVPRGEAWSCVGRVALPATALNTAQWT